MGLSADTPAGAGGRGEPGVERPKAVTIYGAGWNEPDETVRSTLLERPFAKDRTHRHPPGAADGRAALVSRLGGLQATFPGRSITFVSGVDLTGAGARWTWLMENESVVELEGMDFAEFAPDGRIVRIVGFFGPLPPLQV